MIDDAPMSTIARYYVADKNETNAAGEPIRSFPGVPLADIDEATWATLPDWLKQDVDASDMYRKTRPDAPKRTKATEE